MKPYKWQNGIGPNSRGDFGKRMNEMLAMNEETGQAEKSIHWDAENKPIDEGEMVKFLSFNICAE